MKREAVRKAAAPKKPKAKSPKPKAKTKTKQEEKKMAKNNDYDFSFMSYMTMANPAPPPKPAPPGVKWDEIIGQAEAKAAVREAVEGATKHAELYKKYGRRPTKGILLWGPPGNGKTMLGKAAASYVAEQHGQAARESGFIYVKGGELFHHYLGQTEQKIRDLFAKAAAHKSRYGYPAVIFIDEAESLLSHRNGGKINGDLAVGSISVPAFLAEMDGLVESSAIVILATNMQQALDPAVIREGRIDRKIRVGRPSEDDVLTFLEKGLEKRPVAGSAMDVAREARRALFDAKHTLYRVSLADGTSKEVRLGDFTSGARVAYLIDSAASFAIEREIRGEGTGIETKDFVAAVERLVKEQRGIDHTSELAAFCEPFITSVVGVERANENGTFSKKASLIQKLPENVKLSGGASC